MDRLYIVIPAYNEEENIERVICEWHEVVARHNASGKSRLVIVDDGSADKTLQKARALQKSLSLLEVLTKPNSGHGAAIFFAYNFALKSGADYIFQTDSDGQTLPEEFEKFWAERKKFDFVIGHRAARKDGISRILVTRVLRLVVRLCFGVFALDANTPFRLMKSAALFECLKFVPENFNLTNVVLTVAAHKKNFFIKYIPITFRARQGGKNSINLKSIFKIAKNAIKDFARINKNFKKAGL